MVNKRGFLKIVEASIAILVIFSVILILATKSNNTPNEDLGETISPVLEAISANESIRNLVLSYDLNEGMEFGRNMEILRSIEAFVKNEIANPSLNSTVRICELEKICSLDKYPSGDVYTRERVIATNLTSQDFEPRKVKIFLWRLR